MSAARPGERGSALLAMLVIVVICGALAASVIIPNIARHRAAEASLQRERAFQLAEAGIDWGVANIRARRGELPDAAEEQRTVGSQGQFVIRYSDGTTNGVDDDGDGEQDEGDETDFVIISATGTAGISQRTLEVTLRRSIEVPMLSGAVQFNVDNPIIDLRGNAFLISGEDHDLAGDVDAMSEERAGIASPADVDDIRDQIPSALVDQVVGLGGEPSVSRVSAIDLDSLAEQARAAATVALEPGTHSGETIGEPTPSGVVVAYANGDLHISGNSSGAGILVVDGDLTISGSFIWTGLVIVRGRVRMTGGGNGKRVIGGVMIGEEISSALGETEVTVSGTVDMLYSSSAIQLASQSLVVMTTATWIERPNP